MQLKTFRLSDFTKNLLHTITRFPLTVISILLLTVFLIMSIHSNKSNNDVLQFATLSIVATLSIYLFAEQRFEFLIKNLLALLAVSLIGLYTFNQLTGAVLAENVRFVMLFGTFFMFIFVAPFITSKNENKHLKFVWDSSSKLITAYFFGAVLLAGLSLAIVSLDKLFGVYIYRNTYTYLAVCCFILFSGLYFIASIPHVKDQTKKILLEQNKFLKILATYILLPILSIYAVILYLYLFKITITWTLPNGWISWLVSIFGIVGYKTLFLLKPQLDNNENNTATQKLSKLFHQYFPIIILPLLVLMFVGIIRRISDYDLTINRLLVLLFNLWMFGISFYYIFSKKRVLKWLLISLSAILLVFSVGPWSVMSISKRRFLNKFEELVTVSDWKNLENLNDHKLNEQQQAEFIEISKYLEDYYGEELLQKKLNSLGIIDSPKNLQQSFNLSTTSTLSPSKNTSYFHHEQQKSFEFDTNQFQHAIYLNRIYDNNILYDVDNTTAYIEGSTLYFHMDDRKGKIELAPQINTVIDRQLLKDDTIHDELIIETNNYKLIIYELRGEQEVAKKTKINGFSALLLIP